MAMEAVAASTVETAAVAFAFATLRSRPVFVASGPNLLCRRNQASRGLRTAWDLAAEVGLLVVVVVFCVVVLVVVLPSLSLRLSGLPFATPTTETTTEAKRQPIPQRRALRQRQASRHSNTLPRLRNLFRQYRVRSAEYLTRPA